MCFMGIPTLQSTKVSYIYFQLTAYNLTRNDLKKKQKNERKKHSESLGCDHVQNHQKGILFLH
jgi:hypothetical protein